MVINSDITFKTQRSLRAAQPARQKTLAGPTITIENLTGGAGRMPDVVPESGPGYATPLRLVGSRAWAARRRCGVRKEVPRPGGQAGADNPSARSGSSVRRGWPEYPRFVRDSRHGRMGEPGPVAASESGCFAFLAADLHNPQGPPLLVGLGADHVVVTPAGGRPQASHPAIGTRARPNKCPTHSGPTCSVCKDPFQPIPAGLVCFLNQRCGATGGCRPEFSKMANPSGVRAFASWTGGHDFGAHRACRSLGSVA